MDYGFLACFEKSPFFTTEQLAGAAGATSRAKLHLVLVNSMANGQLIQLKRGIYMTRVFYDRHHEDKDFLSAVSAIQVPGSYISLEFVLQQCHMLAATTEAITSVTAGRTHVIINRLGTFWYRHLCPDLINDFSVSDCYGIRIAHARPAKALFDYLYLKPLPLSFGSLQSNEPPQSPLEIDHLSAEERHEFARLLQHGKSLRIRAFIRQFSVRTWRG